MHATTVAVDLAKTVFQLAVQDHRTGSIEHYRLSRAQFKGFFHNRVSSNVVMGEPDEEMSRSD